MASPRRTTRLRLEAAQSNLDRAGDEFRAAVSDLHFYGGLTRAAAEARLVQDCQHTHLALQAARLALADARRSHYGTLRMLQVPKRLRSEARLAREHCSANKAGRQALARRAKRIERMEEELRALAGVSGLAQEDPWEQDTAAAAPLRAEAVVAAARLTAPLAWGAGRGLFRVGDDVQTWFDGRQVVARVDAVLGRFVRMTYLTGRKKGTSTWQETLDSDFDLAADSPGVRSAA